MIYLTDLIAWALVHIGILYLITESAIFAPVRRILTYGFKANSLFVALLYCAGCCGFWVGLSEGLLGMTIFCPPEERWLDDALRLPRILTEPFALVLLTGFAGMGLGAWWGGTRVDQIGLMYHLEQSHKMRPPEGRDVDARTSAPRPSGEQDTRGDATDRPDGDG